MDMIEKVARALYAIRMEVAERTGIHEPYTWETDNNAYREHCLREARAAIEAMREPTDEMVTVGVDDALKGPGVGAYLNWRDYVASRFRLMIDAALTPSPASR